MSSCNRIKEIISDYIEGELTREQKKWVESHLTHCKDCDEVIVRVKKIKKSLSSLRNIETSPDFETILRTRIKIESGIGRRRIQELIWTWPARIPIYGMSLALIIIAMVLVIEQINKPDTIRPDSYINTEWYGGKSSQNTSGPIIEQTDNVIYVIERMAPEDVLQAESMPYSTDDTMRNTHNDSMSIRDKRLKQVNRVTY